MALESKPLLKEIMQNTMIYVTRDIIKGNCVEQKIVSENVMNFMMKTKNSLHLKNLEVQLMALPSPNVYSAAAWTPFVNHCLLLLQR